MTTKTLSIFYGADNLPYKDSAREIHFPLVGNTFNGANNTTTIRFYVDRIGGVDSVTWLVVSKLPNGQIGNEVLNSNNAVYDEELGEHYIEFSLSSYYTTLKGDVYLSLNGYQGGVEVEQDEDTGVYSIYGTPTIQATGVVKIGINYAPQVLPGSHFNTTDLQQVLGLISDKANISDTIILLDSLAADISGFNVGQVFFDKQFKSYWVKGNDNSLQSYDVKLERAVTLTGTETIANLILPNIDIGNWGIGKYNDTLLFVKVSILTTPTPHLEYTIYQLSNTGGIKCWYNNNATGSETIASIVSSIPTYEFATKEYISSNFVNLTGNQTITGQKTFSGKAIFNDANLYNGYITTNSKNYFARVGVTTGQYVTYKLPSNYSDVGAVSLTLATENYVNSAIADFLQNEYTKVNTTTYPTLNDFLESTGEEGYIYLYPIDPSDETKGYYQYIWENDEWVSLGTTTIDLTGYVEKTQNIAGITLANNISSQALTNALVFATNSDIDNLF